MLFGDKKLSFCAEPKYLNANTLLFIVCWQDYVVYIMTRNSQYQNRGSASVVEPVQSGQAPGHAAGCGKKIVYLNLNKKYSFEI